MFTILHQYLCIKIHKKFILTLLYDMAENDYFNIACMILILHFAEDLGIINVNRVYNSDLF